MWPDASQRETAVAIEARFQSQLKQAGYGAITTEILDMPAFHHAETYHQQYLAKNPHGYCGLGGTGVTCPIGTGRSALTPIKRLPIPMTQMSAADADTMSGLPPDQPPMRDAHAATGHPKGVARVRRPDWQCDGMV